MKRLELSQDADNDLDQLLTWSTTRFDDAVASEYHFSFQDSFSLLSEFNFAGSPFEGRDDLRVWKHRSHRIFYRVDDDRIFVARILHYAQNAPSILD